MKLRRYHEFHKLEQNLTKFKTFSIFHINISSINAKSENIETLLTSLEHKYDVIALSETWTPKNEQG